MDFDAFCDDLDVKNIHWLLEKLLTLKSTKAAQAEFFNAATATLRSAKATHTVTTDQALAFLAELRRAHNGDKQRRDGKSIFSAILVQAYESMSSQLLKSRRHFNRAFTIAEGTCLSLHDADSLLKVYRLTHQAGFQMTMETGSFVSLIDQAATNSHKLSAMIGVVDLLSDVDSVVIEQTHHLLISARSSTDTQLRVKLLHLLARLAQKVTCDEPPILNDRVCNVIEKIFEQEIYTARRSRETDTLWTCMRDLCSLLELSCAQTQESSERCAFHPMSPLIVRGLPQPLELPPRLHRLLHCLRFALVAVYGVLLYPSQSLDNLGALSSERKEIVNAILSLLIDNLSPPSVAPAETPPSRSRDYSVTPDRVSTPQHLSGESIVRILERSHAWFIRPPFFDDKAPPELPDATANRFLQQRWLAACSVRPRAWPLAIMDNESDGSIASLTDFCLRPLTRSRLTRSRMESLVEEVFEEISALSAKQHIAASQTQERAFSSWHSSESRGEDRTSTTDTRLPSDADEWGLPRMTPPRQRKRRSTQPVAEESQVKLARTSGAQWTRSARVSANCLQSQETELQTRQAHDIAKRVVSIFEQGEDDCAEENEAQSENVILRLFEKWDYKRMQVPERQRVIGWILKHDTIPSRLLLTLVLKNGDLKPQPPHFLWRALRGDIPNLPCGQSGSRGIWASMLSSAYEEMSPATTIEFLECCSRTLLRKTPLLLLSEETRKRLASSHHQQLLAFDDGDVETLAGALDEICGVITACSTETRPNSDPAWCVRSVSLITEVWARVLESARRELPIAILSYLFTCHLSLCRLALLIVTPDDRCYEETLRDSQKDWSSLFCCTHPAFEVLYERMLRHSILRNLLSAWTCLKDLISRSDFDNITSSFGNPWTPATRFVHRRGHLLLPFQSLQFPLNDASLLAHCPYHPLKTLADAVLPIPLSWAKWLMLQNILAVNLPERRLLAQDIMWLRLVMSLDKTVTARISGNDAELSENCFLGLSAVTARVRFKMSEELRQSDFSTELSPLDFVSDLIEILGEMSPDAELGALVRDEWAWLKVHILSIIVSAAHRLPLVSLLSGSLELEGTILLERCEEIEAMVNSLGVDSSGEWIEALMQVMKQGCVDRSVDSTFLLEGPAVDWRLSMNELETFGGLSIGIDDAHVQLASSLKSQSPGPRCQVSIPDRIVEAVTAEVRKCSDSISSELLEGLKRCLLASRSGDLILAALELVEKSKRVGFQRPKHLASGSHRFAPLEDHQFLRALLGVAKRETAAGAALSPQVSEAILRHLLPGNPLSFQTEICHSLRLMEIIPTLATQLTPADPSSEYRFASLEIMADSLTYIQEMSNAAVSDFATIEFEMCSAETEDAPLKHPKSKQSAAMKESCDASSLLKKHQERTDQLVALATKTAFEWFESLGAYDLEISPPSLEVLVCQHAARLAGDFVQFGPMHPTLAHLWILHWQRPAGHRRKRLLRALLPWIYKFTASLSVEVEGSKFALALTTTLEKLALHFPLETLTELSLFLPRKTAKSKIRPPPKGLREERCVRLIENVRAFSARHAELVVAMRQTFDFYICLAEAKFAKRRSFHLSHVGSESPALFAAWTNCRGAKNIPLITSESSTDDESPLLVSRWEDEVVISSAGKSLPKILTLYDTDGFRHRQLVKNEDDVRQDRTVQTILKSVDQLFCKRARLITYKIVPLSSSSGVIEFLENCFTVRDLLFKKCPAYGSKSCHEYYYPEDTSIAEASQRLMAAGRDRKKLLETFRSIKHHPALPKLLLNLCRTKKAFLSARRLYLQSTASQTVLNWILGVGDRHLKNIMLRTTTGEVTHIDFGYIFEAGRLLPLPERVPFRWTSEIRELVSHSEEEFAKYAVELIGYLRQQEGCLVSAVSVFVGDLLPHWHKGKTTSKAANQPSSVYADLTRNRAANLKARKGILRMRHKIKGQEFSFLSRQLLSTTPTSSEEEQFCPLAPTAQGLTPIDQLKLLLLIASNEELLSQMYVGWTPWI